MTVVTSSFAGPPQQDSQSAVVKRKAQEFSQALVKGEYGKVVELTYPKFVKESGGRDKVIASLEMERKRQKDDGLTLVSATVGKPGEFLTQGENTFVMVKTTHAFMHTADGKVGGQTYLLGISSDQGETWRFIQGTQLNNRDLRARVLPKLPPKLKLPAPKE